MGVNIPRAPIGALMLTSRALFDNSKSAKRCREGVCFHQDSVLSAPQQKRISFVLDEKGMIRSTGFPIRPFLQLWTSAVLLW